MKTISLIPIPETIAYKVIKFALWAEKETILKSEIRKIRKRKPSPKQQEALLSKLDEMQALYADLEKWLSIKGISDFQKALVNTLRQLSKN